MADLSKLSDEELLALKAQKSAQPKADNNLYVAKASDLENLSDADLMALRDAKAKEAQNPAMKVLSSAGEGLKKGLEVYDSYTGAPTRAAISAAQDGENPISAFSGQFGEDPNKAPTGQQIARKAGVSGPSVIRSAKDQEEFDRIHNPGIFAAKKKMGVAYEDVVSDPSAVAGFGVDVAADPTLGVGGALKGAGKVLGATSNIAKGLAAGTAKAALNVGDAATGTKIFSKTPEVISGVARDTAGALKRLFKPTQSKDFGELRAIAQKNGIDPTLLPESVEFGQVSTISRMSRNLRESPIGQEELERFEEGLNRVQGAFDSRLATLGGGQIPTKVQAGDAIREGFDKTVDKFFQAQDLTHSKIIEAMPGLPLSPQAMASVESKLKGLEHWAKGRTQRGFTNADRMQGEQVLRAIDAVRSGKVSTNTLKKGTKYSSWVKEDLYSYKRMYETLSDIGRVAFKSKYVAADVPPDVDKFRDLYFTIRDALTETAGAAAGEPVKQELIRANKEISDFLTKKAKIASLIQNPKIPPENVFNSLVLNGNSEGIQALREMLPPEQFALVKSAFLEGVTARNVDHSFNFNTLYKALRNKQSAAMALLEPDELVDVIELVRLGDSFGPEVLSTSGTGASSLFSNLGETLGRTTSNRTIRDLLKEEARGNSARLSQGPSMGAVALEAAPSERAMSLMSPAQRRLIAVQAARGASVQPNQDSKESAIIRRIRGK